MEVMQISRPIMEYLDAFVGCKPVVHSNESLIIRGKTYTKFEKEEMLPKLLEMFDHFKIKNIEKESKRAREITDKADGIFRKTEEVYDESKGLDGIENIKQIFESTGFNAEYVIGQIEDLAVYVVLYTDKSGFGPMFVETMVLHLVE